LECFFVIIIAGLAIFALDMGQVFLAADNLDFFTEIVENDKV
jgi:hypothetical protein